MKNIRTISRGNDGVSLQFTDKLSSGNIKFFGDKFIFDSEVQVPGGGTVPATVHHETALIDLPSITAGSTYDIVATVEGVDASWNVFASTASVLEAGIILTVRASGLDQITLSLYNSTTSPVDPANNIFKVTAIKMN